MNTKMFCFQCEQTANCKGCTGNSGVCGKSHVDAGLQDSITGALISLANTLTTPDKDTSRLIIEGYSQQSLTSASTRQPNTHYSHASAQHHTTWPKSGTLRKIYAH